MAQPSTWKEVVEAQYRDLVTEFADKTLPVAVAHSWLGFWMHQLDRLERSLGVIANPLNWQGKASKFVESARVIGRNYQGRTDAGIQSADHLRALLMQWAEQLDAFRQQALVTPSHKPISIPDPSLTPKAANSNGPAGRPSLPGAPVVPVMPVPIPASPRISASTLILLGVGLALLVRKF